MAVITFWNDGKKQVGQTATIAALATYMSLNTTYKLLMFNTEFNDTTFTECFWPANNDSRTNFVDKSKTDVGSGISGLAQAILSNKTSSEIITNYTKVIFKNKLELLTEKNCTEEAYGKQRVLFKEIVKMANKYYDLVFVDLEGDLDDSAVTAILENSNIIVVTTTQSLRSLNEAVKLKKENEFIGSNKRVIMLGRYDEKSKYNVKNIERHIGEKKVYAMPYNTLYFESCNEGQVADYFIKLRKIKPTDPNFSFIESARVTTEELVEKIKLLQMYE